MSFLEKNWQKKAADSAVQNAMRIVGASVAAYATKKLTEDESTNAKKTIKNISSPLITAAGIVGSMIIADPNIRAICEGVATFAALKSIAVVAPSVGEAVGLKGVKLQDMPVIMNGVGVRKKGTYRLSGTATPASSKDFKPIMNGTVNGMKGTVNGTERPVFQRAERKDITL